MDEKNVVLLGESHFVFKNGITQGILDTGFKCFNLSLGGTPSLQNLYELIRNKKLLENADLIITGSNTHDVAQYNDLTKIKISIRNIQWLYKELSFLNKKILIFIAPTPQKWLNQTCIKIINNIQKKLSKYYGFNVIDLHKYYSDIGLYDFQALRDEAHDFDFVMREIGKNIALNIDNFNLTQRIKSVNDNPKFEIISDFKLQKMITPYCDLSERKTSLVNEKLFDLDDKNKILINDVCCKNYNLIGMHFWGINGGINFGKQNEYRSKHSSFYCHFKDMSNFNFIANNKSEITVSKNSNIDLISFFLASPEGNYHTEEIDFEALANENIEIPEEYNFNHLIPPIELYKEIIDEYCATMDPRKLASLQKQISVLTQEKQDLQNKFQNELNSLPAKKQRLELANLKQDLIIKKLESKKLAKSLGIKMSIINPKITFIQANSAKARIQNHLSYKLGQTLIENSKSILGYIRMPYVLSYIKDKHKFKQKAYEEKIKENPNLALPPLETYPDYNEALKEKECFTYKLGEALMQANKNWYGGGISNLYSKMFLG
ncbi:hypothetical protein AAET06_000107 [Campylobacter jejuni]